MVKGHIRPAVFVLMVLAALAGLCALTGRWFPQLHNGQTLPTAAVGQVYSLEELTEEPDGSWRFELVVEEGAPTLMLLSGRFGYELMSGEALPPTTVPQFYAVLLDKGWVSCGDGTQSLSLHILGRGVPENPYLYLATETAGEKVLTYYGLIFAFGMGVALLMSVYGFSLWRRKRSEGYLAWFAAFAASLFLWSVCSLPPGMPGGGNAWAFSLIFDLSVVLNTMICLLMCDFRLPIRAKYGVAAMLLIFLGAELLAPAPLPELMRFAIYTAGVVVLIHGVACKRPGAWLLLVGYAVSYSLRVVMLLGVLSLTHVNFLMLGLRYSKIFNLPFAFACMFFINRRFADKFAEAEALARQLEQANYTLDKKVEERTAALVAQQEQRRAFMMNIFHDLRTPLFALKGCTEDLERDGEQLPRLLPVMEDRLSFVGKLTEDLFLMAKLEDGKVILETERVPMGPIVQRVADACCVEGGQKGVEIRLCLERESTVWGDELRLEQVIQNLSANAVYYTPAGGSVELRLTEAAGRALFSVRDTGVGIAPHELEHIFERYYRVANTGKHESTGLGLSIAQELVRLHRGELSVESIPGKGTVFTLSLPALS